MSGLFPISYNKRVLIHYIGDETIASNFSHGNSKKNIEFHCTCLSLLSSLAEVSELPSNVCKHYMLDCLSTETSI